MIAFLSFFCIAFFIKRTNDFVTYQMFKEFSLDPKYQLKTCSLYQNIKHLSNKKSN
jgi:hypothetical protein